MGALTHAPAARPRAAGLRVAALRELWRHRRSWQLPVPRALMRRERDRLLSALIPAIVVVAAMAGYLLFVMLPTALDDAHLAALTVLWPAWVVQAAPLVAALLLSLWRAPALALELAQRQQRGEFVALAQIGSSPAVYPCLPMLVAHAAVAAAASTLMIALSLLTGFAAALALGVGDLRRTADAMFSLVSPVDCVRSPVFAALLGLLCSLAVTLYAWPGTQNASAGLAAQRLGVRAMGVSAAVTIAAAVLLNLVMGWLLPR